VKVPAAVLDAIRAAALDGPLLRLAGPRMTPTMYRKVNEVIEATGGQWDTRQQAHAFPGDAATAVAAVLETGTVVTAREKRQDSQFFPTPAPVVARLIALADIAPQLLFASPCCDEQSRMEQGLRVGVRKQGDSLAACEDKGFDAAGLFAHAQNYNCSMGGNKHPRMHLPISPSARKKPANSRA